MLVAPFFRRQFVPFFILFLLALMAIGVICVERLASSYIAGQEQAAAAQAALLESLLKDNLAPGRQRQLAEQVRGLSPLTPHRISVIAFDGTVLADSEADPDRMDNQRYRVEIVAAAARGEGTDVRYSEVLHRDVLYTARRSGTEIAPPLFLRIATPLADLAGARASLIRRLGLAAVLTIAALALVAYILARRQAAPLQELTAFAQALGTGDLRSRLVHDKREEVSPLFQTLNTMADSLRHSLRQIDHDRAELATILSSLTDGVIATDLKQRVILVNNSAGELLGFPPASAGGKMLWEIVRQEQLIKLAGETLRTGERQAVQLGPIAGHYLEVTLRRFPHTGAPQGLVLVIHDATESARYHELRKEFVANVSHELRTPLTVIKGYVETLLDWEGGDPAKMREFLHTIQKHTDQLANLVRDLLDLSALESQQGLQPRESVDLAATARRVIDLLTPAAARKGHALTVEIPTALPPILGHTSPLERAVSNLVENAIKYTPDGGRIALRLLAQPDAVVVEVSDTGIGIPKGDQARIFERFYRVDRSRSRDMGGTGLGLSIVKHVAQVHGGSVEVESTVGQGSIFRLRLPLRGLEKM